MPCQPTNPTPQSLWNSLEITKLVVSSLTPIVVACLGIMIHRATKAYESKQWRNQKLIEKKIQIYDVLAPAFNDLFCYFNYIGDWKKYPPSEIVALKRSVDKSIYLASPFFSPDLISNCLAFQKACFQTYAGWGREPLLKTSFSRRKEAFGREWQTQWETLFSDQVSSPEMIKSAYDAIMVKFAEEIGIVTTPFVSRTGKFPKSVQKHSESKS